MAELGTIARPYAKAAFQLASEHNAFDLWSAQLATLAAVYADERVATKLQEPNLTGEQKVALLAEVFGSDLAEQTRNLLTAMAENGRLSLIPEVFAQFEQLKNELGKELHVVVESPFELSDAQAKTLVTKLSAKFGREVSLSTRVNQELIGGVIIRAGDVVIDGSVTGKLAKLVEAMNS